MACPQSRTRMVICLLGEVGDGVVGGMSVEEAEVVGGIWRVTKGIRHFAMMGLLHLEKRVWEACRMTDWWY
jgi:hypothetical protein